MSEAKPFVKNLGILGLDRKAMEQERLARANARKRKRSISPPASKRGRLEEPVSTPTPRPYSSTTTSKQSTTTVSSKNNPIGSTISGLCFPTGVVKKTWSCNHPVDNRTIKIEEIIDKKNVRTAVLSTFIMNPDWILTGKFDVSKTKFFMILHAKTADEKAVLREDFDGLKQARLCLPSLTGAIGCQHSKLMLLFFADFVRVAIPSANLVNFDWGETGFMENSVFIIDLPRKAEKTSMDELPFFGRSLFQFLKNQGVVADVREGLLGFDFGATEGLAFIHTSEGAHLNDNAMQTGLPSLSAAVRQLGLDTDEDIHIDFAASSIGSLSEDFINTVYEAAQGKDITTAPSRELRKTRSAKVHANMRVYFPTNDTVNASMGGPNKAGTVCLQKQSWTKPGFPRDIFRDYRSSRQGLLSHNKLLFVRGKKDGTSIAWVYVGSANCSQSAWGNLVTKSVKLACNNWESGVLIPVEAPPEDLSDLGKVFESVMDVPFEYGEGKGLEYGDRGPWFFMRKDR